MIIQEIVFIVDYYDEILFSFSFLCYIQKSLFLGWNCLDVQDIFEINILIDEGFIYFMCRIYGNLYSICNNKRLIFLRFV